MLIDWEYTRLGDPADEIAYLFDQNGLDPSRREAFWRNREPSYYLDHVTRRLDRLDDLSP